MNIPFPSLMDEMIDYCPFKFKTDKAKRIYNTAISHNKLHLAKKIRRKYQVIESDMAIAFAMSLLASHIKK